MGGRLAIFFQTPPIVFAGDWTTVTWKPCGNQMNNLLTL